MSTGCDLRAAGGARWASWPTPCQRHYRGVITKMIPRRPIFGACRRWARRRWRAPSRRRSRNHHARRRGAARAEAGGAGRAAGRARRHRARGLARRPCAGWSKRRGRRLTIVLDARDACVAMRLPCAVRRIAHGRRRGRAGRARGRPARLPAAAALVPSSAAAAPELRDRFHESVTRGLQPPPASRWSPPPRCACASAAPRRC